MSSRKNQELARKTRKARLMDKKAAQAIQAVGDAADYEMGREVRVYDSYSTREQISRRELFVAERRMLTPCEDFLVSRGIMPNPWAARLEGKPSRFACAWYSDGRKVRMPLEQAQILLESGEIVKYWDLDSQKFVERR